MRRVLLLLSISILGFYVLHQQVSAQSVSPSLQVSPSGINPGMQTLQQKALARIDQRMNDLLALVDKIGADTGLSDTVKSDLTSQIRTVISQLNTLKAKISQDPTNASIRQDFAQVLSQKVYACLLPKLLLTQSSERFLAVEKELEGLSQKSQGLLDSLQSQGIDTTALKALLADLNKQLAAAKTALTDISLQLPTINPAGNCSQGKSSIMQHLADVRKLLQQTNMDIVKLQQFIDGVKPSIVPTGPIFGGSPIPPPGCYYGSSCMGAVGTPCKKILVCPSGVPTASPVPPPGCSYQHVMCPQICVAGKGCAPCNPILVCPSTTVTPPVTTCFPRPPCLNAVPRCLIAEPARGWCPVSVTPVATGVPVTP